MLFVVKNFNFLKNLSLIIVFILNIKSIKNQCSDVNPPDGGYSTRTCVGASTNSAPCEFPGCKQGCTPIIPLPASFKCQSNGWNPEIPKAVCRFNDYCPQRSIPNGNTCGPISVGEMCEFFCSQGYEIIGQKIFQCRPRNDLPTCVSEWEQSPLPVCTQTVTRCPDLFSRDNNLIFVDTNQCRNALPNSRCQFNCANGYTLSPNINYLDCNSNSQWSAQLPICVAGGLCESVPNPSNARLSGNCTRERTSFGSVCTVSCFDNCFLSGNIPQMDLRCIGQSSYKGWNQSIPDSCQRPQYCDSTTLQFASTCQASPIGGTCTVTCLPGYRQSGDNLLVCVENPQPNTNAICLKPIWSPSSSQPFCTQVSCPDITNQVGSPSPIGICTNAAVNDVCTWNCGPGYRNPLNNGQQMTTRCQANGQWDGPIQCVQVLCPTLPRPIDGTYTDETCNPGIPGSLCQFSCFPRFALEPPTLTSILCQQDGTWTNGGIVPQCIPLPDCVNVPDPLFSRKSGHCVSIPDNPLKVGSVCKITCYNNCYLSDGTNPIQSLDLICVDINGITNWDRQIPTECQSQTQCQPFDPIVDGSACGQANVGQSCTLSCNAGYSLFGSNVFNCILPTTTDPESCPIPQWSLPPDSGPPPSCEEVLCPAIEIDNAQGGCGQSKPGGKCSITCNNGDTFELTCSNAGQWEGEVNCPPPPGEINCEDLVAPENGAMDGKCEPGVAPEVCTFSCSDGFEMNGDAELTCGEDGVWSADPPTCTAVASVQCEAPPPMDNINTAGTCNPGLPDEKCTLSCASKPSRTKTFTCQSDGQWSDLFNKFNCGTPGCPPIRLPNGAKNVRFCSPGRIGKRCEMGCGKGFKLDGKNSMLCTMGGKWVGKTARCMRQCRPISGQNGRLSGQCSPTGVQNRYCQLRCNSGFALAGPRTALCGANGLWAPTVPRCLRTLSDCG